MYKIVLKFMLFIIVAKNNVTSSVNLTDIVLEIVYM
jgi:hypothetical protein